MLEKLDGGAKKQQAYDWTKYLPKDIDKDTTETKEADKKPVGGEKQELVKTEHPPSPLPPSCNVISPITNKPVTCASLMPPVPMQRWENEEIISQQFYEIIVSSTEPVTKRRRVVSENNAGYFSPLFFLVLFLIIIVVLCQTTVPDHLLFQ